MAQFVLVESRVDMSSKLNLSAKGWFAIGLVMWILAAFAISIGQFIATITAFTTAGIAAFDSTRIHLCRYKTWLSYGPVGLFVICALIWPFAVRDAFVQNPT